MTRPRRSSARSRSSAATRRTRRRLVAALEKTEFDSPRDASASTRRVTTVIQPFMLRARGQGVAGGLTMFRSTKLPTCAIPAPAAPCLPDRATGAGGHARPSRPPARALPPRPLCPGPQWLSYGVLLFLLSVGLTPASLERGVNPRPRLLLHAGRLRRLKLIAARAASGWPWRRRRWCRHHWRVDRAQLPSVALLPWSADQVLLTFGLIYLFDGSGQVDLGAAASARSRPPTCFSDR